MNQSFYTAVSGSKTYQSAIDVTSNNIANINTIGYKSMTSDFSSLFSQSLNLNAQTTSSDKSFGSTLSTSLNLKEGSIQTTTNTFDMAIHGDGWFGISNNNVFNSRDISFSRNGVFSKDVTEHLVTTNGNYLLGTNYSNIEKTDTGYKIDPTVKPKDTITSDQSKLFVPKNLIYPTIPSTEVKIFSNINDNKVFYTPAHKDTKFSGLHSDKDTFLNMKDGENITLKTSKGKITLEYKEDPSKENQFSTIKEFNSLVAKQLNKDYPNKTKVYTASDGSINIYSNDIVDIDFIASDNTNELFLSILAPINGTTQSDSTVKTFAFHQREKEIIGSIIDPNGRYKDVKITMLLTDERNSNGGNSWQISSDISTKELLDKTMDMKNINSNDKRVGLRESEDLWIKAGLGKTTYLNNKLGATINLSNDTNLGQSDKISFNLDGVDYSFNIADNSLQREIASQITEVLQGAGYNILNDGKDNITILPKDKTLVIKNGTSTIPSITIDDLSTVHMSYGKDNDFTTTDSFVEKINSTINNISLDLSIVNGELSIKNNTNKQTSFSFVGAENTNYNFLNEISSVGGLLEANSYRTSAVITGSKIYNSNSSLYEFTEDGSQKIAKNIILKNDTVDLTLNLESVISTIAKTPIVDGFSHNGVQQGKFIDYTVADSGDIIAAFSNGKQSTVGKVTLYHFQNDQGLEKVGDNLFIQSQNSGKPFFYMDKKGNYFEDSTILSKTLENSNVDTSIALTELIVYQRSFGGTAKAITTSDQMIQNAINLKK